ncbi:MAG: hypothetical protein LH606_10980 [Cytophagaceae bacterium]|nr:hypothetical protein [Cytophagaceae bacterium]
MKKAITLLLWLSLLSGAFAQRVETVYRNPADSTWNSYRVTYPEGPIRGIVFISYASLTDTALATQLGFLHVSAVPGKDYFDTMFDDRILETTDEMLGELCRQHHVLPGKVILGGFSAAGTMAVRYAQYCAEGKSKRGIRPAAIFAGDPPLDYERLWHQAEKSVKLNFHPVAAAEGKSLMDSMIRRFGGSPQVAQTRYRSESPYNFYAEKGGRGYLLGKTPLRLYTEPDVHWWMENRRKDYYDLNAMDCAGLVNELRIQGSSTAELITTTDKGYRPDGTRHPHSWSIMDEKDLMAWCLRRLE